MCNSIVIEIKITSEFTHDRINKLTSLLVDLSCSIDHVRRRLGLCAKILPTENPRANLASYEDELKTSPKLMPAILIYV